ncbi:probable basic-leucine zipper transcription factor Q isoform X1 [Drosophila albomicans]|uniref:Probable basic-leucine zipper transcription factor Q isoform X1 n=1 Tax=Drosophila albomicans TaxID=7291 RepID=A0A6P8XCB0_DROAB|nr:probable basic-leucine zipper transcription factor Q isoform X1 [Drosophila albomicans]
MEFVYRPTKYEVEIMWSQVVTSYGMNHFSDQEWQEIFVDFCKCLTCDTDPYIGMDKVGEMANDLMSSGAQYAVTPRPLLRSATSVGPFSCNPPTQPQYVSWREQRMANHSVCMTSQPMQQRRYPSVRHESVLLNTPSAYEAMQFKPTVSNAEFFKKPASLPERQIPPVSQQKAQRQALHPQQRYQSAQQLQQQQQHQKLQQQLSLRQQQKQQQLANPTQQKTAHATPAYFNQPSPKKPRMDSYQQGMTSSQLSEVDRRNSVNFGPKSDGGKMTKILNDVNLSTSTYGAQPDPLEDWLKNYPDKTASELTTHVGDTDKFFDNLPSLSTLLEPTPSLGNPVVIEKPASIAGVGAIAVDVDNSGNDKKKSKKKKSKQSKN